MTGRLFRVIEIFKANCACLVRFLSATAAQAQTQVKVTTNLGELTLELFDTAAPGTVDKFS